MTTPYTYTDHLESPRLYTRFLTTDDIQPWSDFFKDEEAIAFFPAIIAMPDEERSKDWIGRQLARYREKRYGLQAIIEKNTDQFVGMCGLLQQEVDGLKETEVGYHMFKKYWGNGYAPEAARLFIHYAFDNDLTESVISIIDIGNINSQRVAEKNGLRIDKQTRYSDLDVYIYRVMKSDWLK